jgi:Sigma-70 region 2
MLTATSSAVAVDTHAQTDEDVIRQVLDDDSGMFEPLMRRYNERVYRAARAIVRDEQEAEDVMQQAFHHESRIRSAVPSQGLQRFTASRGARADSFRLTFTFGASSLDVAKPLEHVLHLREVPDV